MVPCQPLSAGSRDQILSSIFNLFQTSDLVTVAPTCRHIHDIVVHLLQQRLQIAAGLDRHTLYLECGPPAAKWTTSKVFCSPLGTPGLEELVREVQDGGGAVGHIGQMSRLYSRFRPVNKEPDFRSVPRPHPAGDVPGSNTYLSPEQSAAAWKSYTEEPVTRAVNVDADMLFSQLETVAYLGRREHTRGLLCSIQEVCEGRKAITIGTQRTRNLLTSSPSSHRHNTGLARLAGQAM